MSKLRVQKLRLVHKKVMFDRIHLGPLKKNLPHLTTFFTSRVFAAEISSSGRQLSYLLFQIAKVLVIMGVIVTHRPLLIQVVFR